MVAHSDSIPRADLLYSRRISVRTGKAFWSRGALLFIPTLTLSLMCSISVGPGLCFTGGSGGVYPTAAKNFPALRFIPDVQDDFASLLQA